MRQYVLTRSAFGPEWSIEANRRRLAITHAVTVPLMAAQTNRDWTWVVLLHARDPLAREREALFASAAPRLHVIRWSGSAPTVQDAAFAAYRAPWSEAIGPRDDVIVQTRLDDDDGLAPSALADVRARAGRRRAILMFPRGIRVWAGRYSIVRHDRNAMHTLITGPRDELGVYDYGHTRCRDVAQVRPIHGLGWLWVRHSDAISGWHVANRPLDERVRRLFPVDWPALDRAWA